MAWNSALGFSNQCTPEPADFSLGRIKCFGALASRSETMMTIEWPRHEASLHLTHKEQKSYYQTVQQRVDDEDQTRMIVGSAPSRSKRLSIRTNAGHFNGIRQTSGVLHVVGSGSGFPACRSSTHADIYV
jgi:hypothetical protein